CGVLAVAEDGPEPYVQRSVDGESGGVTNAVAVDGQLAHHEVVRVVDEVHERLALDRVADVDQAGDSERVCADRVRLEAGRASLDEEAVVADRVRVSVPASGLGSVRDHGG